MSTIEAQAGAEWVRASAAAAAAGVPPAKLRELARGGWITYRQCPGMYRRYKLEDCKRFARESVRPARRSCAAAADTTA